MVKLRLKRLGKKHQPFYRVVAIKARTKRDGQTIEEIGFYNPFSKKIKIDAERAKYWLSQGAQPSNTVARLFVKEGIVDANKYPKPEFKKEAGKKSQERKAKKAEKEEAKKEVKKEEKKEEKVEEPKTEEAPEAKTEETKSE